MSRIALHTSEQTDGMSDDDLIARIAERREDALETAVDRHSAAVSGLCHRICGNALDAHSVMLDVFWQLWRNAQHYNHRRGSLRTYLLTIARSRAIDQRRAALARQANHGSYVVAMQQVKPVVEPDPCKHQMQSETAKDVRLAIGKLPPVQQRALELAFFDGLTHSEVSRALDIPLGTAKTHIRKGLMQLRCMLLDASEVFE